MKKALAAVRDFFVSLQLTVALLVLGMLLVFFATLAQVQLGVWGVQAKYFHSFIVYGRLGGLTVPVFPGGYLLGGLLIANLVAAHIYRFRFAWRKAGIIAAHSGLILLLVGELLSGIWQKDYTMRLANGETRNYAESVRTSELAIIDTSNPKRDEVVSIPEALLARRSVVQYPKLPFQVVTKAYYPNSVVRAMNGGAGSTIATAGFGTTMAAIPQALATGDDSANSPSAFVELLAPGQSLGTYLVSTQFLAPQRFTYAGHDWEIMLRATRAYYPFSLTLLKFTHDRYPGTDIPKNFASKVELETPDHRGDRNVMIYMNNPLRYDGLTFYQAGFEPNDQATILQVVRNPSWMVPYIACALVAAGLMLQFLIHLVGFVGRRRRTGLQSPGSPATPQRAGAL